MVHVLLAGDQILPRSKNYGGLLQIDCFVKFRVIARLSDLTLSSQGGALCAALTNITAYLQNGLEFGVTAW